MKKYILGISMFAILGLVGTQVLAGEGYPSGDVTSSVSVSNDNHAYVETNAGTIANTGGNSAGAWSISGSGSSRAKGGMIVTGDATATTDISVGVNSNDTTIDQSGCGCELDGDLILNTNVSNSNHAKVKSNAFTVSNTGLNKADALSGSGSGSSRAKGGMIATGKATAVTTVGVIANVNLTSIMH